MKTTEIINRLNELVEKYGDCEFNIYKSYSKETISNIDIFHDDSLKDICIGVYA